jgi:hypothetical protein
VLYLEGQTDEVLIKAAWGKLRPNVTFPYEVRGKVSCTHLRKVLDEYQHSKTISPTPILFLWDFDKAFDDWHCFLTKPKGSTFASEIPNRTEELGLVFQAKDNNPIYGALLPVPTFRKDIASKIFGSSSGLYIELLFTDDCLGSSVKKVPTPGKGHKYEILGNKVELAKRLAALPAEHFKHFEPLLGMLETLLTPTKTLTPPAPHASTELVRPLEVTTDL